MRRAAILAIAILGAVAPASARAASNDVRELPVSFRVTNVNSTYLTCTTTPDERSYTVRGHLVGTAAALRNPKAVSLYLHGLGFGAFFWRYKGAPGYDYAAGMARRGHVSVVIDRLGYGKSGKPYGNASCLGAQATVAHQIVQDLRSGSYSGAQSPRFSRVALIGHSAGGLTAEVEAYSSRDIDALGVVAYSDAGKSLAQLRAGRAATAICLRGGQRVEGTRGPGAYASLGQSRRVARAGFFASASDALFAKVLPHLTRNPCGDLSGYNAAPITDVPYVFNNVRVPVLVVQADRDALFPPPLGREQAGLFAKSQRVTYRELPNSAHAVTFERDHALLQRQVAAWLDASGVR